MPTTVIGLYRTETEVERVENDLVSRGFPRGGINRHEKEDANLRRWLEEQGVPERDAEDYILGLRNGGKLVVLEASDDRADEAIEVMRRHERGGASADMRSSADASATTGTRRTMDAERAHRGTGDETLEVVEEDLDVRTRQVERGGVEVHTSVSERPVEKDVRVRSETVHVDRRPVDREVSGSEAEHAFREKSVSMNETDEEVVVDKRARVVEEVVLSKDVDERTETVRDTVRRTDVDVQRAGGERTSGYTFDGDRDYYRTHHRDTFASSAYEYGDYEPAYRYGIELANHPDYRGRNWNDVSPLAREHWERQNGDTWAEFEPAARHGYERASSNELR
jgi:uncharacterized protein (TIGR02271 family)